MLRTRQSAESWTTTTEAAGSGRASSSSSPPPSPAGRGLPPAGPRYPDNVQETEAATAAAASTGDFEAADFPVSAGAPAAAAPSLALPPTPLPLLSPSSSSPGFIASHPSSATPVRQSSFPTMEGEEGGGADVSLRDWHAVQSAGSMEAPPSGQAVHATRRAESASGHYPEGRPTPAGLLGEETSLMSTGSLSASGALPAATMYQSPPFPLPVQQPVEQQNRRQQLQQASSLGSTGFSDQQRSALPPPLLLHPPTDDTTDDGSAHRAIRDIYSIPAAAGEISPAGVDAVPPQAMIPRAERVMGVTPGVMAAGVTPPGTPRSSVAQLMQQATASEHEVAFNLTGGFSKLSRYSFIRSLYL